MPMLLEQIPRTMAPDTTDLGTFFRGCARVKHLSPVTCSPDGRTDSAPASSHSSRPLPRDEIPSSIILILILDATVSVCMCAVLFIVDRRSLPPIDHPSSAPATAVYLYMLQGSRQPNIHAYYAASIRRGRERWLTSVSHPAVLCLYLQSTRRQMMHFCGSDWLGLKHDIPRFSPSERSQQQACLPTSRFTLMASRIPVLVSSLPRPR